MSSIFFILAVSGFLYGFYIVKEHKDYWFGVAVLFLIGCVLSAPTISVLISVITVVVIYTSIAYYVSNYCFTYPWSLHKHVWLPKIKDRSTNDALLGTFWPLIVIWATGVFLGRKVINRLEGYLAG